MAGSNVHRLAWSYLCGPVNMDSSEPQSVFLKAVLDFKNSQKLLKPTSGTYMLLLLLFGLDWKPTKAMNCVSHIHLASDSSGAMWRIKLQ